MTALVALLAVVGIILWLYWSNRAAVAACVQALGLGPGDSVVTSGTTPEGLSYRQQLIAQGTIGSQRATLHARTTRRAKGAPSSRGTSEFTVLTLSPVPAGTPPFRLQPAGMMRVVEVIQQGMTDITPTGDAAFDAAWHLYIGESGAVPAVLTPDLRRDVTAFSQSMLGTNPGSVAGKMASALLLGSFNVTPESVSYALLGSPSAKVADHLKQVLPLLARVAGR